MRGYDGKTTKNNITDQFSFSFGDQGDFKSDFDAAAVELYKALGEKTKALGDKKNQNDCDMMPDITKYFYDCIMNDEKLVWRYAKNDTGATIKKSDTIKSARSQVSGILSPGIEAQESSEDDEQILRLGMATGNSMQRAVRAYLYKELKENRKEQERMKNDFTIGVFGECG